MIVHSIVVSPHETQKGWYRVVITSAANSWLGRTQCELILGESELRIFRNEIEKVVGPKPTHDLFGEKE